MSEELKSCPFCGSDRAQLISAVTAYITCNNCSGTGPEGYSEDEATEAWNTRAGEKA